VTLRQTAPGQYEGDFRPEEEGVYLVRIVASPRDDGDAPSLTDVTGFVRTYSPEYRTFGTDEATLHRLAEAGGGALLEDPAQVFARAEDQEVVRTYTDVWPWLLGVAICLLPLDVAVRRVILNLRDVRRALGKVSARLRRPARKAERSEQMSRLLSAKGRAPVQGEGEADRPEGMPPVREVVSTAGERVAEVPPPPLEARPEEDEREPGTMTSRLLAAKRRAQRKEQED
jgi:hypothetical protein